MKKLVLLLALVSLCFSPACEIDSEVFTSAMPFIGAALLLSAAAAGLAYAVGTTFNNPQLLLFGKEEVMQTVISGVLVATIQGTFVFVCLFSSYFIGGADPLDTSLSYLSTLRSEGGALLGSLISKSIEEQFNAAVYFGYSVPISGGETFAYNADRYAYARGYDILFDFTMVGYISVGIQYFALRFIKTALLGVFLPFGLILRFIPQAREAGNIVIALVFAAYIFLPLAYAVNSTFHGVYVPMSESPLVFIDRAGVFIFHSVFLPNLALVIFATAAAGFIKIAKVMP